MAISEDIAAAVLAGFKQGVIAESKRQATALGKEAVRELPGALIDTSALVDQSLMFVEDTASMAVEQAKRKPSTYNRKYAAAYRRIKKKKTLKNGKMAKGFGGKTGHKKIVKMAHAEVKKAMRRKK